MSTKRNNAVPAARANEAAPPKGGEIDSDSLHALTDVKRLLTVVLMLSPRSDNHGYLHAVAGAALPLRRLCLYAALPVKDPR
jgi:hypothetical protein